MTHVEGYGGSGFCNLAYCVAILLVIQCCLGRGFYN